MEAPFILTNHPGRDKSPTWAKMTYSPEIKVSTPWASLNSLLKAYALFRQRTDYKVVVLGGGSQVDMFYLILQRLFSFRSTPVVKIDCLWYESPRLKQTVKKRLFGWVDKIVDNYVVWASREITDYAKAFDLPVEKFAFIPYHTTVNLNDVEIKTGDYLFSGGNFARDYKILAKAVEGLDLRVIVACTNRQALKGIPFPENVTVLGVSHHEYMALMAKSGINVVSLAKGLLHAGGQQTFLNAMVMGKPVIVTDPQGAKDYIEDGVDGILVPPGDVRALRSAIQLLQNDWERTLTIGKAARKKALQLNTEANLSAIANIAAELASRQNRSRNRI